MYAYLRRVCAERLEPGGVRTLLPLEDPADVPALGLIGLPAPCRAVNTYVLTTVLTIRRTRLRQRPAFLAAYSACSAVRKSPRTDGIVVNGKTGDTDARGHPIDRSNASAPGSLVRKRGCSHGCGLTCTFTRPPVYAARRTVRQRWLQGDKFAQQDLRCLEVAACSNHVVENDDLSADKVRRKVTRGVERNCLGKRRRSGVLEHSRCASLRRR